MRPDDHPGTARSNTKNTMKRRNLQTWQNALLATSGLAALLFASIQLWQQGYPQWAFVLAFTATWALLTLSWSNVDYAENSGSMLARIMDHNFNQLHDRLVELENELERLRGELPESVRKAS